MKRKINSINPLQLNIDAHDLYDSRFVENLFNRISFSYNNVNKISTLGISKNIRKKILNTHFKHTDNKLEILDLMSGNGETWNVIQNIFPNGRITALDFSIEMYKKSIQNNKIHFNNNVHIINEDFLNNNLENNSFDIVICAFGLKHFNENQKKKLVAEIKRILKPNGQFSFFEISIPSNLIFNKLFTFQFKYFLPFIAKIISNKFNEFKLLWSYIKKFENCQNALKLFHSQNLDCNYHTYFLGTITSIHGIKK